MVFWRCDELGSFGQDLEPHFENGLFLILYLIQRGLLVGGLLCVAHCKFANWQSLIMDCRCLTFPTPMYYLISIIISIMKENNK